MRLSEQSASEVIARDGILLALASAFSFLESLIPAPAGIRLGLSSLVILYALYCLSVREAAAIVLLKSAFVLLTRGVTAGILSCTGGVVSLCGMLVLLHCGASLRLTSAIGGLLHNLGQLLAAMLLLSSTALRSYLPLLAAAGLTAGTASAYLFRLILPFLPNPSHFQLKGKHI